MSKSKLVPYTGTEGHNCVSYYQKDCLEIYSTSALRDHANKLILSLQRIVDNQEKQIILLKKSNGFYGKRSHWGFIDGPFRDSKCLMIKTIDNEYNENMSGFISGKLARQTQKQLAPLEEELKELMNE